MNAWAFHAEGIQEIQNEVGGECPVLTWGGQDYILLPGSAQIKLSLVEGGYDQVFDFTATALLSTFAQYATVQALSDAMQKTTFTYLGKVFRFQSVWLLAGGFQIQINGNAAKQASAAQ